MTSAETSIYTTEVLGRQFTKPRRNFWKENLLIHRMSEVIILEKEKKKLNRWAENINGILEDHTKDCYIVKCNFAECYIEPILMYGCMDNFKAATKETG